MTDDRYPDVPDDADGMDAIVRILSEMDENHTTKAVGLVLCARTEYRHAVADGEISRGGFNEFVDIVIGEHTDNHVP